MANHSYLRDAALLALAGALGWWAHDANTSVHAQHGSSDSARGAGEGNLAFQVSGAGLATSLTVYNPGNHTLYVYPAVTAGSSHINCGYSLRVEKPGAAIERENCPMGSLYSR